MAGVPPLKNSAFSFEIALDSQADGDVFQTSVTLAAGDVQVSKDGGAFSNITSLPTEISSTGVLIVALTATEMNADRITVRFHDAAGDEWKDRLVNIFTETVQINDLATSTALQTVDDNVDAILVDTGTTLDDKIDAIKAKTDTIPADPAETSDIPSAASVADAVWDELLADHEIAQSAGAYLAASGASSDPLLNTVPGSYASGTAGAALGRIGSGQITTVSPVAQSGDVETIMGDDYSNTDSRALDWTDTSASWPTLTSAAIVVTILDVASFNGSVVTATGDSKKVRLELADTQTDDIPAGWHQFQVVATLASGNIVTLVEGNWLSKERLSST